MSWQEEGEGFMSRSSERVCKDETVCQRGVVCHGRRKGGLKGRG